LDNERISHYPFVGKRGTKMDGLPGVWVQKRVHTDSACHDSQSLTDGLMPIFLRAYLLSRPESRQFLKAF
jgi:hypothetical protein